MQELARWDILHLLLKRGMAARDPLLDADMMCGYVCVCLFVGQEKCVNKKQPSKSDPWSSFGGASHELPKRVMGPELFLDVPKKGTYLEGHASPSAIGQLASVTVGPLLPAVYFKNLCPTAAFLLFFSPSFLSVGTNPYPKACSHPQDVLSFIPCPE